MKKYAKFIDNKGEIKIGEIAWTSCGFVSFTRYDGVDCSHILKETDTIEELCDEFVIVSYSTRKVMYQTTDYDYFDSLRKKDFRNHPTINNKYYGAIWIEGSNGEPILKSVAKMNDKGELELV